MYYVTFYCDLLGGRSKTKAIECKEWNETMDCALDICSICDIKNVRINKCGRLPKGTIIIKHEEYLESYHSLWKE